MFVYSLSVVIIIHPCKDQNNEGQHMIRNIDSKVQKFNQDLRYHQVWIQFEYYLYKQSKCVNFEFVIFTFILIHSM